MWRDIALSKAHHRKQGRLSSSKLRPLTKWPFFEKRKIAHSESGVSSQPLDGAGYLDTDTRMLGSIVSGRQLGVEFGGKGEKGFFHKHLKITSSDNGIKHPEMHKKSKCPNLGWKFFGGERKFCQNTSCAKLRKLTRSCFQEWSPKVEWMNSPPLKFTFLVHKLFLSLVLSSRHCFSNTGLKFFCLHTKTTQVYRNGPTTNKFMRISNSEFDKGFQKQSRQGVFLDDISSSKRFCPFISVNFFSKYQTLQNQLKPVALCCSESNLVCLAVGTILYLSWFHGVIFQFGKKNEDMTMFLWFFSANSFKKTHCTDQQRPIRTRG